MIPTQDVESAFIKPWHLSFSKIASDKGLPMMHDMVLNILPHVTWNGWDTPEKLLITWLTRGPLTSFSTHSLQAFGRSLTILKVLDTIIEIGIPDDLLGSPYVTTLLKSFWYLECQVRIFHDARSRRFFTLASKCKAAGRSRPNVIQMFKTLKDETDACMSNKLYGADTRKEVFGKVLSAYQADQVGSAKMTSDEKVVMGHLDLLDDDTIDDIGEHFQEFPPGYSGSLHMISDFWFCHLCNELLVFAVLLINLVIGFSRSGC